MSSLFHIERSKTAGWHRSVRFYMSAHDQQIPQWLSLLYHICYQFLFDWDQLWSNSIDACGYGLSARTVAVPVKSRDVGELRCLFLSIKRKFVKLDYSSANYSRLHKFRQKMYAPAMGSLRRSCQSRQDICEKWRSNFRRKQGCPSFVHVRDNTFLPPSLMRFNTFLIIAIQTHLQNAIGY